MIVGELGPVEVELIYTLIFFFTGAVWGCEAYETTFMEATGLSLSFLSDLKLKVLITMLTFLLVILFCYDNIKDSLEMNAKESLRLLLPVIIITGLSFISSLLPSFTEETVIVYFFYQMVFAILILKLMLLNMAGKPYSVLHIQFVYPLIPIVAFLVFGVSSELEIIITRSCLIFSFCEFFYIIYRLSV